MGIHNALRQYQFEISSRRKIMAASATAPIPIQSATPSQAVQATSWAPTAKVAVGALAGAVTLIIVQICGHYGLKLSAEVGAAVTTVITFAIQYMTPERR
jgi:hypothetical protein